MRHAGKDQVPAIRRRLHRPFVVDAPVCRVRRVPRVVFSLERIFAFFLGFAAQRCTRFLVFFQFGFGLGGQRGDERRMPTWELRVALKHVHIVLARFRFLAFSVLTRQYTFSDEIHV